MTALGPRLARTWVGYRRRVEEKLRAEGFDDHRFPDGLIVRLARSGDDVTISDIGRELGMTRQGASKLVAGLRERGYVELEKSATDGREKVVRATPRARSRLAAAARIRKELDAEIRAEIGDDAFRALDVLFDVLVDPSDPRPGEYWRDERIA